jgi:hypothetical protein
MMFKSSLLCCLLLFSLAVTAAKNLADPSLVSKDQFVNIPKPITPDVIVFDNNRQAYFGDLHIHTGLSTDAYILGVRNTPEDVYSFAKGGVIQHGGGYPIQIKRPLDFAAITDHAEYMGQARLANMDIETTRQSLASLLRRGNTAEITKAWSVAAKPIAEYGFSPNGAAVDTKINKDAWQLIIDTAEKHYQPGAFTSFIGYEWSADAGDITAHLHRNVIYRGSNVAEIPFSSLDSNRPEDLWEFLQAQNQQGKVSMAIPHNANFSRGNMYAARDSDGKPLTAKYAQMRSRYEPISEILQIKGSSDTHPILSTEDEFADFEILGESLLTQGALPTSIKGSYSRDALRVGMELSHSEGFNPFKYGVIGSSDSHNASSPSEESDYTGKLPMFDGSAGLRTGAALDFPPGVNPATRWSSGGLAGVWAEANTRESLFDALMRKETFATSGPRILVRFFGGWNYSENMLEEFDFVAKAYASGVPMGGDLVRPNTSAVKKQSPGFFIVAQKDGLGANLDRAQVIKAWVDNKGVSHEKVFDVASADDRVIDTKTGKLPVVGNTVDSDTASYNNTIGGESLSVYWIDPEFDSENQALYYVRILEIPTPRWSTYDAVTLGIKPMQPVSIQERAITSAIWYKP